jgi:hypothetical protein
VAGKVACGFLVLQLQMMHYGYSVRAAIASEQKKAESGAKDHVAGIERKEVCSRSCTDASGWALCGW